MPENFAGKDLSGVDFSDADLTGANLTGANLTEAYLMGRPDRGRLGTCKPHERQSDGC